MKCKRCGSEFEKEEEHCPKCGLQLENDNMINQKEPEKRNYAIFVYLILIVVVVVMGLCIPGIFVGAIVIALVLGVAAIMSFDKTSMAQIIASVLIVFTAIAILLSVLVVNLCNEVSSSCSGVCDDFDSGRCD